MLIAVFYVSLIIVGIVDTDITHSNDIQTPQPKPKMSAKQLLNTAQKVANGEVTLEQVKQHFDLSEEQESKLVDSAI